VGAKREAKPPGYVEHRWKLSRWSRRKPLVMWLNPDHGRQLTDLADRAGLQLAWATTWEHQANTMVAPVLGLPPLAVVDFDPPGEHWKYRAVTRFAGDRPLAWLDDDFDLYPGPRDAFLERRQGKSTELVRVDPHFGMTAAHLDAVERWAASC
jgi:hypothetical protein